MNFKSILEFRKRDKREGKNKPFLLLKFEDPSTGDDISFYSPFDRDYKIEQFSLKKGVFYEIELSYNYNRFEKLWRMDLVDICREVPDYDDIDIEED